MRCPKTAFSPLKIATIVVTGIALAVHIAAITSHKWDGIDAIWNPVPGVLRKIQASGSLWDFKIIVDQSRYFFPPVSSAVKTEWKEPIKLMELTAIGVGVISFVLMILSTFIDKCVRKYIILLLIRVLAVATLMCAALEIMLGAMLYKYQYTKTASYFAFNPNYQLPVEKFLLQTGWYLECAAGGLFLMATLIAVIESIHNSSSKDGTNSTSVVPIEEQTHNNDKKA